MSIYLLKTRKCQQLLVHGLKGFCSQSSAWQVYQHTHLSQSCQSHCILSRMLHAVHCARASQRQLWSNTQRHLWSSSHRHTWSGRLCSGRVWQSGLLTAITRPRFVRWKNSGIGSRYEVPKVKASKSEVKRLFSLAAPEKYRLTGAILLLVVSSAVTLTVPFGIGRVIDIIYSKSSESEMVGKLTTICQVLACVFIIGGLANFGRSYLMSVSGQHIVKRMRQDLFASIVKQEMAFFDKTKTGELINRLSTDTSLVGMSVTMNISDGLRSAAQAIGGVTMMFVVCPKLTGVALCVVPPVVGVSIIYGRYVRNITRKVQDALAESTQVAEERLSNMRTVRAFAHENQELETYNKRITDVLNMSYKEALASGLFWGFTGLSGNMVILTVFYYGGLMMNDAAITVGDLSSFMMYAAYVGISLGGLTAFYSSMMKGLGASTRIWELTDKQPAIPLTGGLVPSQLQGNIVFRDVHFSYPTRPDAPIFSGLTLDILAGQVLAVVGASGSGKSTLASLLLRYYDPQQGEVLIDDHPVTSLDPSWVRSHMSIVSQEPALFSCSIRENIAFGAADPTLVSEEEIIQAAKMANAYNFIKFFPRGMDTMVGERGVLLSGGQKQRIAIARAILKNPKILLLDEATSALDAESEYLVQEALDRVMKLRTVIVIAHRLSTIKNAHQIAVLDQGRIAELGTYDDLIKIQDGLFRKLVDRQTITNS